MSPTTTSSWTLVPCVGRQEGAISYFLKLRVSLTRKAGWPVKQTTFALISLGIIIAWIASDQTSVPAVWGYPDLIISVFFAVEFFTRSGLRWDWKGYMQTRFFDFLAIVPALTLIYFHTPYEGIWIWVILAARSIRVIDRVEPTSQDSPPLGEVTSISGAVTTTTVI